jgi:hypothetical protein
LFARFRHSIPLPEPELDRSGSSTEPATTSSTGGAAVKAAGCLLGSRSNCTVLRRAGLRVFCHPIFHDARIQPLADEP